MIKFIKNDFWRVREALCYLTNREIPFGVAVLYYIIVGLIFLPLAPFAWIWSKIYMKVLIWRLKRGF